MGSVGWGNGGGSCHTFIVTAFKASRQPGPSPRYSLASRYLARNGREAENESVPAQIRFVMMSVAIMAACMSATAQYHDRDTSGAPKTSATAPAPEARVDINHASADELLKVPGMTPTWAGRIVRFRPYRTKQDLLDRGVVTSAVYDRIKDYVIAHRNQE